jgi:choline dehydrogenase-like flavoprotein
LPARAVAIVPGHEPGPAHGHCAGLTVADASIMSSIVSSPTRATAVMIGERAAAFLLEDA